ncbi:hypothetical protein Tsubulata_049657 [Turnera subulata]|uniref:F-box domain-containing protein n=1 Tax=Turnera subulata TaxID=218843 RepID=A0A9Q0JAN7_9ROSI|nr:hypothetical protein Tsubulata_049657 [Turnera subulata]
MSVSISGKRQRVVPLRALQSSSSPPVREFNLDDSLLAEILRRLPGPRFLFQCTCVCKQWYSVISSPYFARLFINNNIALLDEDHEEEENNVLLVSYEKNPFGVIASCATYPLFGNSNPKTWNVLLGSNHYDPLFQSLNLRFNYLPVKKEPVHVLAVFNDLVLCCADRTRRFLVNPFTRKWVALPPGPRMGKGRVSCGLVCEPHCVKDSKGDYTFNSQFRYRVVLIVDAPHARTPSVNIYRSETGEWSTYVHRAGEVAEVFVVHSNVIAYKGRLLWCIGTCIVVFDPFLTVKTRYIKLPPGCPPPSAANRLHVKYSIGLCRGFLLLLLGKCYSDCTVEVTVFQLVDYRLGGIWKVVHKQVRDFIKCYQDETLPVLSCHPSDPDIVYSTGQDMNIISCNLHIKEWEVTAKMSHNLITVHPSLETFPLVLPLWPTPIPVPAQHS